MVRKLVRRFLAAGICGVVILLAGLYVFQPLLFMRLFPQTIPWNSKLAWAKCHAVLSGWDAWPRPPKVRCRALSTCLNEARLSPAHSEQVTAMMRNLKGCYEP